MDVQQLRLLSQGLVGPGEEGCCADSALADRGRPHAAHEEDADEGAEEQAGGDAYEDERGPAGGLEDGAEGREGCCAWGGCVGIVAYGGGRNDDK